MNNLAVSLKNVGRPNEALEMNKKVLELYRRLLPENHPDIGEKNAVYGRWFTITEYFV
jgi:hypothetical protein